MRIAQQLIATALATALSTAALGASRNFDKVVSADARGVVEISNTAGSIEVSGWDRPEVSVRGDIGEGVERVDVTSEGGRTQVRVVLPGHSARDGEATLHVQVPKASELHITAVSAETTVTGVQGLQRLNAVSGDVSTEIAGSDLELKTVSGSVKVKGHGQSARLYLSTVSGDVHLEHGAGDLEMSTVSGSLGVTLDAARSVRVRTTSGDVSFTGKLTRGGSFEASSVSGDLNIRAGADGGYAYELSSFSGDIENCFGAKSDKGGYVGHSLAGTLGGGAGHVRLKTMSGDIELCDRT
jgi:DUF4097 and DUF4098 domain-containing protein YvlB